MMNILWHHYGLLFASQRVDYRKFGELTVNCGEHQLFGVKSLVKKREMCYFNSYVIA